MNDLYKLSRYHLISTKANNRRSMDNIRC